MAKPKKKPSAKSCTGTKKGKGGRTVLKKGYTWKGVAKGACPKKVTKKKGAKKSKKK